MKTITLEIITPEKSMFKENVDSIVLPGKEGQLGVLPGHMKLFVLLQKGNVVITKESKPVTVGIEVGAAHITPSQVTVYTDGAIMAA